MASDLAYWRHLTRCATKGLTDEQVEAVAAHAFAEEQAGRPAAVWHSAAQVMGYPERCQCRRCRTARGEER